MQPSAHKMATAPIILPSSQQDSEVKRFKEMMFKSFPGFPIVFLNAIIISFNPSNEETNWKLFCEVISLVFVMLLWLTTTGDYPKCTSKELTYQNRIVIFIYCLMVLTLPISLHTEMDWYQRCLLYVGIGLLLVLILLVYVVSFELPTENDTLDGSSKESVLRKYFKFFPLNHTRIEKFLMYTPTTVILVINRYHENHLLVLGILLNVVITLWVGCGSKIRELKCIARQQNEAKTDKLNDDIKKWQRASTFLIILALTLTFIVSKCIALDDHTRRNVHIGCVILLLQVSIFHIGLVELKEEKYNDVDNANTIP